jgi:Dipeptidyl peptidase IV (DPP IV) N-terminal region
MKTVLLICAAILSVNAQVTEADYQRAAALRDKLQPLAVNLPGPPTWISSTRFWYRKTVSGGHAFFVFDTGSLSKSPAFDHDAIAQALSTASGEKYTGLTLPFNEFGFDGDGAIQFTVAGTGWRCELSNAACKKLPLPISFSPVPPADDESPAEFENDVEDGMVSPQQGGGRGGRGGAPQATSKTSPDGKWDALIQNYNVFLRAKGSKDATALSWDGSEGNAYTFASIEWSPDSTHLAAYRVRPG